MRLLLLLPVVLLLAACGKDESKSSAAGVTDGDACRQAVINDYNSLVAGKCEKRMSRNKAKTCKTGHEDFLAKYPAINCRAKVQETGEEITISDATIRGDLQRMEAQGI